ncbi:hypothetical protein SD70_24825 [Gordoniibacillus kamchatkensis]|uniref:HD domain-containing protein n=1 Tax=Gordoniibacillus kamchatkensis TaxID=1590651 RepID=A0ABR5ACW6_9BACL|nr:hypothetical protein [Paenibacillus sp. VKM B-2647]KIL38678.1 hypothetical protein SD70_24825 [Paenibacillus sp. VKM B-2647]
MEFDQKFFVGYLQELQNHLFPDQLIEDIIAMVDNHHQARRFVAMYLLQDRETFHHYFERRKEFGIGGIVDTVISALFHDTNKKPAKQVLIDLLGISEEMIHTRVEGYAIKEFNKDLNSFLFFWRKRTGKIEEMVDKLKQQSFDA